MEIYKTNLTESGVSKKTALLIIDPQNDFHPGGSLQVPTANGDADRIATLLNTHGDTFDGIFVTLDTHMKLHIAHSMFWRNPQGDNPPPFTIITKQQVEKKEWYPAIPEFQEWGLEYCKQLGDNGRFELCIWPEHCLVGTYGHCVQADISEALQRWEASKCSATHYVIKGNNSLTEHYSAIKADVEIPSDPNTKMNASLVNLLKKYDRVLICGQALSHCVNFTTRDLASLWNQSRLHELVVLTDASSPVPGFEKDGERFLEDMKKLGLTLSTTTSCL